MLRISFLVCLLFSSLFVVSQIPFEGKITYKLKTESEDRSGIIEVFYGKQIIKSVLKKTGF